MALPTTNLTVHMNASNSDDVFRTGTTPAVDGENVESWDDDDGKNLAFWYPSSSAQGPTYRTSSPLMQLACLDFNGSSELHRLYTQNGGTGQRMSNIVTNAAFTILVSVYVEGITANAANPWDNDPIFMDTDLAFGIHVKDPANPKVVFHHWDGSADTITLAIGLNTSYVLMFRHESGNIYASINGGSETSVASGNSASLTGFPVIGGNVTFFNGRIGELAIYNAALTGANLSDAISWFTGRWLAAAAAFRPPVIVRQAVQRAASW